MFTQTNLKQDLEFIQARMAAVARGIQSNPENARDYAQALEVQTLLLNQAIEKLNQQQSSGGNQTR